MTLSAADNHPLGQHLVGLDHVVIRARNPERLIAFYRDVIGCPVERTLEEYGLVQLRAGNGLVDIVDAAGKLGLDGGPPPNGQGINMAHFCLLLDMDEQSLREHLLRHQVTHGEFAVRYGATGFGLSTYIKDPEGNSLELKLSDIHHDLTV